MFCPLVHWFIGSYYMFGVPLTNSISFHELCILGRCKDVLALLEKGQDPDEESDDTCETPLCVACASNEAKVVAVLLRHHANPDLVSSGTGRTPLYIAARCGNAEIVTLLIEKGHANVNKPAPVDSCTPLLVAAEQGHIDVVRVLIEKAHANVNFVSASRFTALYAASQSNREASVAFLVDKGANPNISDPNTWYTPLHIAAQNGRAGIATVLLEKGKAKIDARSRRGETPLNIACAHGHANVVMVLISHNAPMDEGRIFLLNACQSGEFEILQILIEQGHCNVDETDEDGATALTSACRYGHIGIVKALLSHYNATVANVSPLYYASVYGHTEVVNFLLDFQECRRFINNAELLFTPLHAACMFNNVAVAQNLIEKGHADISVVAYGWTPLSIARQRRNKEVARVLLVPLITFLCGHHTRCGEFSSLQCLPHELLIDIGKFMMEFIVKTGEPNIFSFI